MKTKYIVLILLGSIALLNSCSFFPEATFDLSGGSRIPMWFTLPDNKSRSDVKIKMSYYVKPSGRTATFTLTNKENKRLDRVEGTLRGLKPIELKDPPSGFPSGYPSYEVITVNGITEVIEHRKGEPIFYINEDPKILEEFEVLRANNK